MNDKKQETLAKRWMNKIQQYPVVGAVIVFGSIVIGLASFTDSVQRLLSLVHEQSKPRRATPVLFAPEQVVFGSSETFQIHFQNDQQFLIATAVMSYVNNTATGFNSAISREYIRFIIGGQKYQYAARELVGTTSTEAGKLVVRKLQDSGPFTLNAGGAISHEVLFMPHTVKCSADDQECVGSLPSISWSDFTAAIKRSRRLSITILADVYGSATVSAQCTVVLTPAELDALVNGNWSAPDCEQQRKPGHVP